MEKKKIVVFAVIVLVLAAVAGGALLFLGQGDDSPSAEDTELSVIDPELESEGGTTEAGSITGVDTDGDDIADEVAGSGSSTGSSSNSGSNGSSGSSSSSGGSNNSGSTTPTWPEGEAPADDGSTTQGVTYSQYQAMSAAEQQEWFESFDSVEAFFAWYNNAKAVYDANDDSIIVDGNTSIDMGEIAKKQS